MKLKLRFAIVVLMTAMSSLAFGQALQDHYFDSNGIKIRYVEQGTGQPVVLIHGYTMSVEPGWFDAGVFQQLAKNYHVIAFDCRGHGKSDKPHDAKQYGAEMALDVVRLLDHLKIKKAHIVGYSMGSMITAKLLTMKPERFLSATLGGHGGVLAPPETVIKGFEQIGAEMEKGSMRTLMGSLTPQGQSPPTEEQLKQAEAIFLAGKDTAALAAVARGFTDLAFTESQAAAIKVPTIALIGTDDPLIEVVKKLKTAMPALKVVGIQKANHMTAPPRPEFIAALHEFLKANSIRK